MKLLTHSALLALLLAAFTASAAFAADGPPEKTDGFICPILGGQAGENGNSGTPPIRPELEMNRR